MGGRRGRRKEAAMADDGTNGRTPEADGCGTFTRQIGLEISSEMASVAAREEHGRNGCTQTNNPEAVRYFILVGY